MFFFSHVHSIKVNILTLIIDGIVKFLMIQPGHKLHLNYHLVILFNPSFYPGIVMCWTIKTEVPRDWDLQVQDLQMFHFGTLFSHTKLIWLWWYRERHHDTLWQMGIDKMNSKFPSNMSKISICWMTWFLNPQIFFL